MKQLEVGDRVKILDGGNDDEGTVLDVDASMPPSRQGTYRAKKAGPTSHRTQ